MLKSSKYWIQFFVSSNDHFWVASIVICSPSCWYTCLYQRVNPIESHLTTIFLWFSHGLPFNQPGCGPIRDGRRGPLRGVRGAGTSRRAGGVQGSPGVPLGWNPLGTTFQKGNIKACYFDIWHNFWYVWLPSGKRLHTYGQSPCLNIFDGISHYYKWPCSTAMLNYQTVILMWL